MKYCQKCRVMLKDETEVCPVCGTAQLPAEEYEAKVQKRKKGVKTLIIVTAAVLAAVLITYAVIMIGGRESKQVYTDEKYTAELTDSEELAQFVAYIVAALPQIWVESEEDTKSAIEYYKDNNFPGVAAGFEQIQEMRPVLGSLEEAGLKSVVVSEDGYYKLIGEMKCTNGKVICELELSPSGYVDVLHFTVKDETFLQKAREFIVDKTKDL